MPIVALLSIYAMGELITQQLNVTGAVINVIVALFVLGWRKPVIITKPRISLVRRESGIVSVPPIFLE